MARCRWVEDPAGRLGQGRDQSWPSLSEVLMAIVSAETWNQSSILTAVIEALGRLIRGRQTSKTSVSRIEKFARCAAVFPAFSLLVIILRLRALLGRPPMEVVAQTQDGFCFR